MRLTVWSPLIQTQPPIVVQATSPDIPPDLPVGTLEGVVPSRPCLLRVGAESLQGQFLHP